MIKCGCIDLSKYHCREVLETPASHRKGWQTLGEKLRRREAGARLFMFTYRTHVAGTVCKL